MAKRLIVDENVGRSSALWREFHQVLGDQPWNYVFLAEAHPGIPDVEILDKLLQPGTVLLTGDCVLHERAIQQGIRSYTLNQEGQLTRRQLPTVMVSESLAQSVHADLQDDYRHQADQQITGPLKSGLTEKQLKRYRTARRRIRSDFGSARAIGQVTVTVGSKTTPRGLLCGFVLHLAGSSRKGLRAREGYCLPTLGNANAAYPVIHALRDLYLLQLEQVHTEMFIIPPESLELSRRLLDDEAEETTEPLTSTLNRLLHALSRPTLHPCVKGRFFDRMQSKLDQLVRTGSNEVTVSTSHSSRVDC